MMEGGWEIFSTGPRAFLYTLLRAFEPLTLKLTLSPGHLTVQGTLIAGAAPPKPLEVHVRIAAEPDDGYIR